METLDSIFEKIDRSLLTHKKVTIKLVSSTFFHHHIYNRYESDTIRVITRYIGKIVYVTIERMG